MHDGPTAPRLFIVDRVAADVVLLTRMLAGYQITAVADSLHLFKALECGATPDLILLETAASDRSSSATWARLNEREEWRDIPVMCLKSANSIKAETTALEQGAVDCIARPFVPAIVRARVKTHLSLSKARRRLADERRMLQERLTERTAELKSAMRRLEDASHETIVRLARAAEYKDEDTGSHIVRMGQYCAAIARQLGRGEETAEVLLRVAPMHDVGKIAVPDHILLKRGRLDAGEFEIVKQHTELGARILAGSRSPIIQLGELVALAHHERWDGTGYPRGLKEDAIPLAARIVSVADTFDALVSRRPYKPPFPLDQSFNIVSRLRGTAFDPSVVDAFMSIGTEIIDIVATYRDVVPSPLFRLEAPPMFSLGPA